MTGTLAWRGALAAAVLGATLPSALGASAQPAPTPDPVAEELPAPFRLPWTGAAPRIEGRTLTAAAVGLPDARIGRFAARRDAARDDGRRRALAAIHRFVDDALAAALASPRTAARVHAAVARAAEVVGVRPLVDGGAVVVVAVPLEALRRASGDLPGVPWRG
ncbi:MAG: hypothetical protein ACFCGT_09345 [Sandaracinaceae bacterium]